MLRFYLSSPEGYGPITLLASCTWLSMAQWWPTWLSGLNTSLAVCSNLNKIYFKITKIEKYIFKLKPTKTWCAAVLKEKHSVVKCVTKFHVKIFRYGCRSDGPCRRDQDAPLHHSATAMVLQRAKVDGTVGPPSWN